MRRCLTLLVVCVALAGAITGCSNSQTPMTADQAQEFMLGHLNDITSLTKAGTLAIIDKNGVDPAKLQKLRDFVSAAHLILVDPDKPDFDGVEDLAEKMLPAEYVTIAKISITVMEDKVRELTPKVPDKAKAYQQIVAATLDGIMQAINQRT